MATRSVAIACFLLLASIRPALAQPLPSEDVRIRHLEQWLTAIAAHVPGSTDEPLMRFAEWSPDEWDVLPFDTFALMALSRDPRVNTFRVVLNGRAVGDSLIRTQRRRLHALSCVVDDRQTPADCRGEIIHLSPTLRGLRDRAVAARQRGDESYVLRLGILFHTDMANWGGVHDTGPGTNPAAWRGVWVDVTDGRGSGVRQNTKQWAMAYSLIEQVVPAGMKQAAPSRDTWVRDWFAATASWMQHVGNYAQSHLDHGLRLFPNDPDLRFLSGTMHEIDANGVIQQAIKSVSLPAGATTALESPKRELEGAVSDFRIALRGRGEWDEARLRLGRALLELGEFQKASAELAPLADTFDEDALNYYAALFNGGAEEGAGRFEAAAILYEHASTLFPSAQSPRIALSRLARRQGNRTAALQALRDMFDRNGRDGTFDDVYNENGRFDPWWDYLHIQARDAEQRMEAVRIAVIGKDER